MAAKGSQTEESRNVARTGSAPARMAARARLSGVGSKQGSQTAPRQSGQLPLPMCRRGEDRATTIGAVNSPLSFGLVS